jgi:transposase-like protein
MSRNGHDESLTGRIAAAGVLARGGSVSEAATAAGVARATVNRWRKQQDFVADVADLAATVRQDVAADLADASALLATEALASVRVLAELRDSATDSPQVRRGAARDILQLGLQLRTALELEERLAALEARTP